MRSMTGSSAPPTIGPRPFQCHGRSGIAVQQAEGAGRKPGARGQFGKREQRRRAGRPTAQPPCRRPQRPRQLVDNKARQVDQLGMNGARGTAANHTPRRAARRQHAPLRRAGPRRPCRFRARQSLRNRRRTVRAGRRARSPPRPPERSADQTGCAARRLQRARTSSAPHFGAIVHFAIGLADIEKVSKTVRYA